MHLIRTAISSSQQCQSKQQFQRGTFYNINFRGANTHTHRPLIVDTFTGKRGSLNWFILFPVAPCIVVRVHSQPLLTIIQSNIEYIYYSVLSITDLFHPKSGGCVVEAESKIFVYQMNGYRKGCEICQSFVSWNEKQPNWNSLQSRFLAPNYVIKCINMFGEMA